MNPYSNPPQGIYVFDMETHSSEKNLNNAVCSQIKHSPTMKPSPRNCSEASTQGKKNKNVLPIRQSKNPEHLKRITKNRILPKKSANAQNKTMHDTQTSVIYLGQSKLCETPLKTSTINKTMFPQMSTDGQNKTMNDTRTNVIYLGQSELCEPSLKTSTINIAMLPQMSIDAQNKTMHDTQTSVIYLGQTNLCATPLNTSTINIMLPQMSTDAQNKSMHDTQTSVTKLEHIESNSSVTENENMDTTKVKILDDRIIQCSYNNTSGIDVKSKASVPNVEKINNNNHEEIVVIDDNSDSDYDLHDLEERKNKLKSLLSLNNTEYINSALVGTDAEITAGDIERILNDPLNNKINSMHRKHNNRGAVSFIEVVTKDDVINKDHCYSKQTPPIELKYIEQNCLELISDNTYLLKNKAPPPTSSGDQKKNCPPKEKLSRRSDPELIQCTDHSDLHELQDEYAVKLGDTFASSNEFIDYANTHGLRWRLYYSVLYSRSVEAAKAKNGVATSAFACVFAKMRQSYYISKGLRKRKNRFKSDCPSRIILRTLTGREDMTVVYVCHHHDHPLTEELFLNLPHVYRLPLVIKEEMYDLISLDVDLAIVAKHISALSGLPIARKKLESAANHVKNKKIEKQFSADKLKQLMEKIKVLREKYGERKVEQEQPEEQHTQVLSTLSTERPVEKKTAKEPTKKLNKTDVMLNSYEDLLQSRSRTTKRKKKEAPIPGVENNISEKNKNESSNKQSPRKSKGQDVQGQDVQGQDVHEMEVNANKRSRLEERLESMAYDEEVLQSIKELQDSVRCTSEMEPWLRHTNLPSQTLPNDYLISPEDLEVSTHRGDITYIDNITDDHGIFENYEDIRLNINDSEVQVTNTCEQDQVETEYIQEEIINVNDEQHDAVYQYNSNESEINYNIEYNVNEPDNETVVLCSDECGDINILLQNIENNDVADYALDKTMILKHVPQERITEDKGIQTEPSTEPIDMDNFNGDNILNDNEITYVDSHKRNVVEEHVNKYNIHKYLAQETFAKYIDHLAKVLNMNVIDLLAKIYYQGGVVKIVSAKYPQEGSTVTLKFLNNITPIRLKNDTMTELERCKVEASMYYNMVQKVTAQIKTNMAYVRSVTDEFAQFEKLTKDIINTLEKELKVNKKELKLLRQKITVVENNLQKEKLQNNDRCKQIILLHKNNDILVKQLDTQQMTIRQLQDNIPELEKDLQIEKKKHSELENNMQLERKKQSELKHDFNVLSEMMVEMKNKLQTEKNEHENLRSMLNTKNENTESLNKQLALARLSFFKAVDDKKCNISVFEKNNKIQALKIVDLENDLQMKKLENNNIRNELTLQIEKNEIANKQLAMQQSTFLKEKSDIANNISELEKQLSLQTQEIVDMKNHLQTERLQNENLRNKLKLQNEKNYSLSKQVALQLITLCKTDNDKQNDISEIEKQSKQKSNKTIELENDLKLKIVDIENDLRMEKIKNKNIRNDLKLKGIKSESLKRKLILQKIALQEIASLVNVKDREIEILQNKKTNNSNDDVAGGSREEVELSNKESNDTLIAIVCDVINNVTDIRAELDRISTGFQKDNHISTNDIQSVKSKTSTICRKLGNVLYNLGGGIEKTSKNNSVSKKRRLDATNEANIKYIEDTLDDNIASLDLVNSIMSRYDNQSTTHDVGGLNELNSVASHNDATVVSVVDTVEVGICSSDDNLEPKKETPDIEATSEFSTHDNLPPSTDYPNPLAMDEQLDDKTNIDPIDEQFTVYSHSSSNCSVDYSKPRKTSEKALGIRVKKLKTMMEGHSEMLSVDRSKDPKVCDENSQLTVTEDLPSVKDDPDVNPSFSIPGPSSLNWPSRLASAVTRLRLLTHCTGHDDKYRTVSLPVEPGCKFNCHADFTKHFIDTKNIWIINNMFIDPHELKNKLGRYTYRCSYYRNQKNNGILSATDPDNECPCKIMLENLGNEDVLTVSYICNHHNHVVVPES